MVAATLVAECATWLRTELTHGPVPIADLERRGLDEGWGRRELLAAAVYLGLLTRGPAALRTWRLPERAR